MLRSTTRPSTENTSEVAPSELLTFCGWVEVIASLAHGSYTGLVKTGMISRLLCTNRILVTLEVSLALEQKSTVRTVYIIPPLHVLGFRKCSCVGVILNIAAKKCMTVVTCSGSTQLRYPTPPA